MTRKRKVNKWQDQRETVLWQQPEKGDVVMGEDKKEEATEGLEWRASVGDSTLVACRCSGAYMFSFSSSSSSETVRPLDQHLSYRLNFEGVMAACNREANHLLLQEMMAQNSRKIALGSCDKSHAVTQAHAHLR